MSKKKVRFLLLSQAALLILVFCRAGSLFAAGSVPGKKYVQAVTLHKPPVIDGNMEDVWNHAIRIADFEPHEGQRTPLTQKTEVSLGYYQGVLYIAFVCWEAQMDKIVAAAPPTRDSVIWGDDCVEFFIDTNNDQRTYYHFLINSRGIFSDRFCEIAETGQLFRRTEWDAENLKVAAAGFDDRWIVELSIPFTDLEVDWSAGLSMGVNFTRARTPRNELSTWAAIPGTFHDPENFGRLWFEHAAFLESVEADASASGTQQLKISAFNPGSKRFSGQFSVFFTTQEMPLGQTRKVPFFLNPMKREELSFEYPESDYMIVELYDEKGDVRYDRKTIIAEHNEIALNPEYVTPHTSWLKPTPGGDVRALFLLSFYHQRDIIEIAQRMDIEPYTAVYIHQQWAFPDRPSRAQYLEEINSALENDLDVIVVGAHELFKSGDPAVLPDEMIKTIQTKVHSGTGLILFGREGLPAAWQGSLTKGFKNIRELNKVYPVVKKQHFITAGVPFSIFNTLQLPVYDTDDTVLATAGNGTFLSIGEYGKGRIVTLGLPGFDAPQYRRNGMMPISAVLDMELAPVSDYNYWDYYFGFLAKCIYWVSGRNPEVEISSFSAVPEVLAWNASERETVNLKLLSKEKDVSCRVGLTIKDRFSEMVFGEEKNVLLKKGVPAEITFTLPDGLPMSGLHFAEAVITEDRGDKKALNWAVTTFHIDAPARITEFRPETTHYYGTLEQFRGKVVLNGKHGKPFRMKVVLKDRIGRIIGNTSLSVDAGQQTVDIAIPVVNPVWRSFNAAVTLYDGERAMDRIVSEPLFYIEERRFDDFAYSVWNWRHTEPYPDYTMPYLSRRLVEAGFTGMQADVRSIPLDFPINTGLRFSASKHWNNYQDATNESARLYSQTLDSKYLVRNPCVNNPLDEERFLKDVRTAAKKLYPYRPLWYHLGDEDTLTLEGIPLDFCFCEHCLAKFRIWLKEQYGSLEALNSGWSTRFNSWEDVIPMTAEQVRGRDNYAPWADHRHFMQYSWADAYRRRQEELWKVDPQAKAGACGTRPMSAHSGIDWYSLLQVFTSLTPYSHYKHQAEVHRSFSDIPMISATALIDSARHTSIIWTSALNNSSGLIFSKTTYAVLPDLSFTDKAHYGKRVMGEFTSGLGKLLMESERDRGEVGVYYSPASCFADWITEFRFDRKHVFNAPFHRSIEGWIKLLKDAGMQFHFVHPEQVKAGYLDEGIKVLVLPYTLAMSGEEAEKISAFVKRGGGLIADYLPGVMDWHCVPGGAGALDKVFGVETNTRINDYLRGKAVLNGGCEIGSVVSSSAVRVNGGSPQAEFFAEYAREGLNRWPAVIVNRFGKGKAVCLNFLYDYRADSSDPIAQPLDREFRTLVKQFLEEQGVAAPLNITAGGVEQSYMEVVPYSLGRNKHYFVFRDYLFPAGQETFTADSAAIQFPHKGYIYAVRAKKFMGFTDRIETQLPVPGEAEGFALLPYRVKGISITVPKEIRAGDRAGFSILLETVQGRPDSHVLRVEVDNPDRKNLDYYALNITAVDGKAEFYLPLAINDICGIWKIHVRDILTGTAAVKEFTVKEAVLK